MARTCVAPRAALLAAARRLIGAAWRLGGRVPRVWLLSDPVRLPDPRAAIPLLPRGAAVVLRGATPEVAAGAARLCARHGVWLLVGGGDVRLALRLGAGLHLPDRHLPGRSSRGALAVQASGWAGGLASGQAGGQAGRRAGGRPALLSAACHGRAGLARARRAGAVPLLSPAFPTESHPGAPALGPHRWARLRPRSGAVALGGVTGRSWRRLPRHGLLGVAGIGFAAVAIPPHCLKEVALRLARALPPPAAPTHSLRRPGVNPGGACRSASSPRGLRPPLGGGVGRGNWPGAPGA